MLYIDKLFLKLAPNMAPNSSGCERTEASSRELGTVYLAPKVTPPPPFKNLPNATPPGWHPPILAYGTHSSLVHIILRVRLATLRSQASLSRCSLYADWLARTGATLATPQVCRLVQPNR